MAHNVEDSSCSSNEEEEVPDEAEDVQVPDEAEDVQVPDEAEDSLIQVITKSDDGSDAHPLPTEHHGGAIRKGMYSM